jgi:hypothetical protein
LSTVKCSAVLISFAVLQRLIPLCKQQQLTVSYKLSQHDLTENAITKQVKLQAIELANKKLKYAALTLSRFIFSMMLLARPS